MTWNTVTVLPWWARSSAICTEDPECRVAVELHSSSPSRRSSPSGYARHVRSERGGRPVSYVRSISHRFEFDRMTASVDAVTRCRCAECDEVGEVACFDDRATACPVASVPPASPTATPWCPRPRLGVRRSKDITRRNLGSERRTPGVSTHPGCIAVMVMPRVARLGAHTALSDTCARLTRA